MHGTSKLRRTALTLAGLCAAGAAAAFPAHGQAPATLRGVVLDAESYTPVDSATVTLVGSNATVWTSGAGVFEIDVTTGPVALQVSAPGHATVVVDLEVRTDRAAYLQIPLPTIAVTLNELLVQARGGDDNRRSRPARTAAELVAQQLPSANMNAGQVGDADFALRLRAASSLTGSTAPTIVVDGVVISSGSEAFAVLDRIPATDVEGIEVLRGPSAAFLYPMAANGVILVTTRRGQRP